MDGKNDTGRMVDELTHNAADLSKELNWLADVMDCRFNNYFRKENDIDSIKKVMAPSLKKSKSSYAKLVNELGLNFEERILLILGIAPVVKPELLDVFFLQNSTFNRGFTEFGGVKGVGHGGFVPTGETAMFILAEDSLEKRFSLHGLFDGGHILSKMGIITIEAAIPGEPFLSGKILLSREYAELFTTGKSRKPNFSKEFPAKLIETQLEWSDLVLPKKSLDQIEEVQLWIRYGNVLMDDWGLRKKIRPGIRVLFHGPPGTGKTMTSCLLGKLTGRDVYRIDLSMVISKYIGETEANLSKVFNQAENKNWILFFDEADALFGTRIQTESSNDMFANQQVSYLLQRIEDFNGVVILSSNMKSNIDKAFVRRFETMVHFKIPSAPERFRLWEGGFSDACKLDKSIDLEKLAKEYELSGGVIMNVVRFSSLMALKRNSRVIKMNDIQLGIRREYLKEGKTL
ncbi:MAG: ATP-binding protein [Crocinitomicaceae bacterium]|nr:ATP-binding protein [Crocinitomicaceae bacterium]